MTEITTITSGRFLALASRDGWEFATRTNASGVVAILALTDEDELIFVEQYRPPVAGCAIEIPAGLVGDDPGAEQENAEEAARRELLEETGFAATEVTPIARCVSSAGLTDETVTFFRATSITRKSDGGGVDNEQITIHLIPRNKAHKWILKKMHAGTHIDAKVFVGLALLLEEK